MSMYTHTLEEVVHLSRVVTSAHGEGKANSWEIVAGLLTLITPGIIAWYQWRRDRNEKRRRFRSSYVAQLKSLKAAIDRELSFLDDENFPLTWFPLLPYLREGDGALASAGLLTSNEVEKVVEADFVYRERSTYIAKYGKVVLEKSFLAPAIGVDISKGPDGRGGIYKADLDAIKAAVEPALECLGKESGVDQPIEQHVRKFMQTQRITMITAFRESSAK